MISTPLLAPVCRGGRHCSTEPRRHLPWSPFAVLPGGCPGAGWHGVSLLCSSRDPPDGLGAQAAAPALCGGPREGLGVGERRQRQRQAGPVSLRRAPLRRAPLLRPLLRPLLPPGREPAGAAGGASPVPLSRQPDPVPGGQAEPSAQLHERDVGPDTLGDPGEPRVRADPTRRPEVAMWRQAGRGSAATQRPPPARPGTPPLASRAHMRVRECLCVAARSGQGRFVPYFLQERNKHTHSKTVWATHNTALFPPPPRGSERCVRGADGSL